MTKVAVLLPCHNEALSIRGVVEGFRQSLPDAAIYVYDNCSSDQTAAEASAAGAIVREEKLRGKGNVVRRMFADIDADVYLIADGDGTYDCSIAPQMIRLLTEAHLDMVVGARRDIFDDAHRVGHAMGNRMFNGLYRSLFGTSFSDIFSGYRAFSRRFVKSFPAISRGFEIETEISVHASQLHMPLAEIPTDYRPRKEGSVSKLRTFQDATKILLTMLVLYKEIRPLSFFFALATLLTTLALIIALPVFSTYLDTGLVPRLPTAVLATGLVLLAGIFTASGLILDSVARGRLEQKRIWYLQYHY